MSTVKIICYLGRNWLFNHMSLTVLLSFDRFRATKATPSLRARKTPGCEACRGARKPSPTPSTAARTSPASRAKEPCTRFHAYTSRPKPLLQPRKQASLRTSFTAWPCWMQPEFPPRQVKPTSQLSVLL